MPVICPTITAYDNRQYAEQLARIETLAPRIHIDVMDGQFAPTRSINLIQVHWPKTVLADIHVMYQRPLEHLETLVSLQPHMVVIHAESEGDLLGMVQHLHKFGIKVGVALLQDTSVAQAEELLAAADHALIFSGNLGHHGGTADLSLLAKASEIKALRPDIEIGWDGGVALDNAPALLDGGVDVLNVGGAIQRADNPKDAYKRFAALLV